jgi:hypothetical protein
MVLCFTILAISNIKKSDAHSLLSDQIQSTCLAVTQSKINSPHLIDLICFLLLSAAKLSMDLWKALGQSCHAIIFLPIISARDDWSESDRKSNL